WLSAQSLKCLESLLEVSFGTIAIVDAGQQVAHRAMAPCHFIGVLGCGKYRNALGDVLPGLGDPAGSDFYLAGESLNQSCNEQGLGLLLFQSALGQFQVLTSLLIAALKKMRLGEGDLRESESVQVSDRGSQSQRLAQRV